MKNELEKLKEQIESNEVEIALLEQLAKYNEDKAALVENIRKTQCQIAYLREQKLRTIIPNKINKPL